MKGWPEISGIGTGVGAGSGVGFPETDEAEADPGSTGTIDGVGRAATAEALGVTGAAAADGDALATGADVDFFPQEHRIANGSISSSGNERDFIMGMAPVRRWIVIQKRPRESFRTNCVIDEIRAIPEARISILERGSRASLPHLKFGTHHDGDGRLPQREHHFPHCLSGKSLQHRPLIGLGGIFDCVDLPSSSWPSLLAMIYSSELRWMFRGEVSQRIIDWFVRGQAIAQEGGNKGRIDEYLLFPGCDSVGVKLRGAQDPKSVLFEIKSILGTSTPAFPRQGVGGKIDHWVKWSTHGEALGPAAVLFKQKSRWVSVGKGRYLRKLNLESARPEEIAYPLLPSTTLPKIGCNFELTEIQSEGEKWFSLGFEAFGPRPQTPHALSAAVTFFLQTMGLPPDCELVSGASMSYPFWLATHFYATDEGSDSQASNSPNQ